MFVTMRTESDLEVSIPQQFSKYRILSIIARGSFSIVLKVLDVQTKKVYACKAIPNMSLTDFERVQQTSKHIRHPNLVYYEDILKIENVTLVIMELYQNGELFYFIKTNSMSIKQKTIQLLFYQVTSAVHFLHSRNIAHRDIKPENILLDSQFCAKLCDFDFVTDPNSVSTSCGTTYYSAPEISSGKRYDPKRADIWSLGVLLYFMRFKTIPWKSSNRNDVLTEIRNSNCEIPPCEKKID